MDIDINKNQIINIDLNNVTLIYCLYQGVMSFSCVPKSLKNKVFEHRLYKNDWSQYFGIDPMVQVALEGDEVIRDFSAGQTLYNSSTSFNLKVYKQEIIEKKSSKEVKTYFKNNEGLNVIHVVSQIKGYEAFETYLIITNKGEKCVLERANSFNIGSLSPLCKKNDISNIFVHEIRSNWAAEGRLKSHPISDFEFEDSWSALGLRSYLIGALGAMPARGHHPFIALEDKNSNCTWAVNLASPSSWEIEVIHRYGGISLTGGQADFLYGHFKKELATNETFITNKALVSVVNGNLEAACANLTLYHNNFFDFPKMEDDLPIIYNEYLNTWGNPTIYNIPLQLKKAKELGAEYFVIDAGWFCEINDSTLGDWDVAKSKFPNGLKEFANLLKEYDYKAGGIWYEFEAVSKDSIIAKEHPDWLLTLNGKIINRNNRMLLDFRKKEVIDYLTLKVINNLKDNNLNYIKIDYNENVGYGVDGSYSLGEGVRENTLALINFMKKLRDEVPNLVLENCSSGGMRHELTYLTLGSMVSFSDAHEIVGGAIIAMDLHRLMQPRQMQIWASILPKLSIDEIYFTMAKAMLGRICLAGKLESVSDDALKIVKEGTLFYQKIKDIIKNGKSIIIDTSASYSIINPKGSIKLVRKSLDESKMLCYAFGFKDEAFDIKFDIDNYSIIDKFGNCEVSDDGYVSLKGNNLKCAVILCERK